MRRRVFACANSFCKRRPSRSYTRVCDATVARGSSWRAGDELALTIHHALQSDTQYCISPALWTSSRRSRARHMTTRCSSTRRSAGSGCCCRWMRARAACVCRAWRAAAAHPTLWTELSFKRCTACVGNATHRNPGVAVRTCRRRASHAVAERGRLQARQRRRQARACAALRAHKVQGAARVCVSALATEQLRAETRRDRATQQRLRRCRATRCADIGRARAYGFLVAASSSSLLVFLCCAARAAPALHVAHSCSAAAAPRQLRSGRKR